MTTTIPASRTILATERDAELAVEVLRDLSGVRGSLRIAVSGASEERAMPRELGILLQRVLEAVASGTPVTVSSIPKELTTSQAAALLGVSRPTVMKMIERGDIPSRKVGSHARLQAVDVLAARRARRERQRVAFERLRDEVQD
ncbi:MAG: helix-turn-helix domain-containing protein [Propionibacteriaceae bacterium]|nr:helix-turn-helix domain-containing protein [Micropruina sp.]HBX81543.1 DNA-binding protein [Propionibacteriaceae bacterium]HBY24510.1 DNA-binding protein [Propionibacteriaceae bacterium]